jgi:hypothetical protein
VLRYAAGAEVSHCHLLVQYCSVLEPANCNSYWGRYVVRVAAGGITLRPIKNLKGSSQLSTVEIGRPSINCAILYFTLLGQIYDDPLYHLSKGVGAVCRVRVREVR